MNDREFNETIVCLSGELDWWVDLPRNTPLASVDIGKLRACRDLMTALISAIAPVIDASDAAELEEAERKVAALRARLKPSPPVGHDPPYTPLPIFDRAAALAIEGDDAPARDPSTLTQAERMRQKWAETDAGRAGAGRVDVDDGTTADEFKGDLHDLRLQTAEKRKRLRG